MNSPRAFGGGRLYGDRIVRMVYIDEAGISANEPFLVVAAILVDADRQLIAVQRHLDKLVSHWIPEAHRDNFIFHATELFNGNPRGSGKVFERDDPIWPLEKRLQIADDLVSVISRHKLPFTTGWIEKKNFPHSPISKERWGDLSRSEQSILSHTAAFSACALKVDLWMRHKTDGEVCMMIVEDNDQARSVIREAQNRHQTIGIDEVLREGALKLLPLRRIKEDPLFQSKRKSSVLQLADFCAYVSKRFLMGDVKYDRFFNPLKPYIFEMLSKPNKTFRK